MYTETWAPLPVDMDGCKSEIDYLQREIIKWNELKPNPRSLHNIKLPGWTDVDFGIEVILEGRRMLIAMRQEWADSKFKHFNRSTKMVMEL